MVMDNMPVIKQFRKSPKSNLQHNGLLWQAIFTARDMRRHRGGGDITLAWMSQPFRSQWSSLQSLAPQSMSVLRSGSEAFPILNLLVTHWVWNTWLCRPAVMGSFIQTTLLILLTCMALSLEGMAPEESTPATKDFEEEASNFVL